MNDSYPRITVRYSLENDKNVVESTLGYADWYLEHGYEPILPGDTPLGEARRLPQDELTALIEKEYDELFYKEVSETLTKYWEVFNNNWSSEITGQMGLFLKNSYTVYLTRYGVGATYNESVKALELNVSGKDVEQLASIVFHELIHLAIEDKVKKYKIGHWHKERLVDLIFKKLLPKFCFEQKLPPEAYTIDEFFKKNSGEVEKTLANFTFSQR